MDGFKGSHWYGDMFNKNLEQSDKMAAKGYGAHNVLMEIEYIKYLIKENKLNMIDE